jgi:hypothetical protein
MDDYPVTVVPVAGNRPILSMEKYFIKINFLAGITE